MRSQILTNINIFIKKRLIETLGVMLILTSIFLLIIISSYSPSDPNFIYTPENIEIKNVGGFYGSVISDFLLQSLGLISFLLTFNFLIWGISLLKKKVINNFTTRVFFTLLYLIFGALVLNIFYNESFWLIDNGNGGFVGATLKENIYYFAPIIENQYVIYGLIFSTAIFFVLSLDLKINEISKIFLSPIAITKKIFNFFDKNKKNIEANVSTSNDYVEIKNNEDVNTKQKQPILPFSTEKKSEFKKNQNYFKLPTINFLEKNPDLRSKKNINETEQSKNSEFLEKILMDFGVEGKIK